MTLGGGFWFRIGTWALGNWICDSGRWVLVQDRNMDIRKLDVTVEGGFWFRIGTWTLGNWICDSGRWVLVQDRNMDIRKLDL
jgi:hypothetical protein